MSIPQPIPACLNARQRTAWLILRNHAKVLHEPGLVRTVEFEVNGILTIPWDDKSWCDRRELWNLEHSLGVQTIRLEYLSGPLVWRTLKSNYIKRRLISLAREAIALYPDAKFRFVGHSNGCDIICHALPELAEDLESIELINLIAAATEEHLGKNNIGDAIRNGSLHQARLFASSNDNVLKYLARPTRVLGKLAYGYGGYSWAEHEDNFETTFGAEKKWWSDDRLCLIVDNNQGHGSWLQPPEFERTMKTLDMGTAYE